MEIRNAGIYGLEESIYASGYPMKIKRPSVIEFIENTHGKKEKHYGRAKKLADAPLGSGHGNYLKGIIVQFDIDFTIKAWTEAERYHWFDFVSSMSTMHRLTKMNFDEVFNEYVTENTRNEMRRLQKIYRKNPNRENELRLLYNCPAGLKLTARITTNYLQLKTIYHQRKNHKLPEWREFCTWIEEKLPYGKELIAGVTEASENNENEV